MVRRDGKTAQLTQPIKYHGGKHYLAGTIISLMPPHRQYVEPYFGGGSVLLRKPCEGISEVVNDISSELTGFWRVLQHTETLDRFIRQVEATPFSEVEWHEALPIETDDDVGRAMKFFVRARQSRQGLMEDFATLSRNRTRRAMNEQVSAGLTAIEGLLDVHQRLQRVVILCREATDVIRQQDGSQTLFYGDPPYLHETRTNGDAYRHEMSIADHVRLLDTLGRIEGKFLLSGYRSDLYELAATEHGWRRKEIEIDNKESRNNNLYKITFVA